jgi:cell division protein FtsZ
LLSIAGGSDLGLFEIHEAATLVQEAAHAEANIIFGTVIDDSLGDEVRVTVIAAGFASGGPTHKKLDPAPVASRSVASAQAGQLGGAGHPGAARPPASGPGGGEMPGRAMPVATDGEVGEVDVPPFMKR